MFIELVEMPAFRHASKSSEAEFEVLRSENITGFAYRTHEQKGAAVVAAP